MQERQDRRKAELDAHLRDVRFAGGTKCSSTQSTRPSRRARCFCHAGWVPSRCSRARRPTLTRTYRLDVPATWRRVFPEFNVERLRPYLRGPAVPAPPAAAGDPAVPAVQVLLKFRMRRSGRQYLLVTGCVGRAAKHPATRESSWSG